MEGKEVSDHSQPSGGGPSWRVLILDDEEIICRLLDRFLGREFDITTCHQSPRDIISSAPSYDAIVCDMTMIGMDAPEIYALLSSMSAQMVSKLIVTTGGVVTERHRLFVEEERPLLVEKPFDMTALAEIIKATCQGEPPIRRAS